MLQYPAFIPQYPLSERAIPKGFLLSSQWHQAQPDELLLADEEFDYEAKCTEIRKTNCNILVIGKTSPVNDKEDMDDDGEEDEDVDNPEDSEGDEFEHETE